MAPINFTPCVSSENADAATMPPITTKSATDLCSRKIFPRIKNASAIPPTISDIEFVSFKCLMKKPEFAKKLPGGLWKQKSFGNCVLARKSATPHLKPVMTLSEMKCTMTPAFTNHAIKAIRETSKAVAAASAPKRAVSPPVIAASDEPMRSEIAEVTETAGEGETKKKQNTKTPNKKAERPTSGSKFAKKQRAKPARA